MRQLLTRRSWFYFTDIVVVILAAVISALIIYEGKIPVRFSSHTLYILLMLSYISITVNIIFNLYSSLWKYASIDELIRIVIAGSVSAGISLFGLRLSGIAIPNIVFVLFTFLYIGFIGTSRMSYRIIKGFKLYNPLKKKSKINRQRVMIIGAGDAGAMVLREMNKYTKLGLRPVAIIDDDRKKHHSTIMGVPIYGGRESIQAMAKKHNIDEIIISIPSASKNVIKEILDECKKTKCKLKTVPGIYDLLDGKVEIQQIRDVQIEDLLGRDPVKVNLNEISGYLRNEVILVTGGGGSIGSELCRQIAKFKPKKLLILDIYENNAYDIEQELRRAYPNLDLEILIASVRDRFRMEAIFNDYRPSVVFHAAAHKHVPLMENNPTEAIKNNIFGTLNVAEFADKYKTKRFIFVSTDKAVNPTNIMGATKRTAEMIIQAMDKTSQTDYMAVRFGNVLGSNGSVIPLFKKQIAEGGPVTVTHPEINRFFMTIAEAVQLVIQAGALAKGGEIFVLDMGQPVKIIDLANDIIRLSGFEPGVDIEIKYIGLRPGEKLYEELLMSGEDLISTKHAKIFIEKPSFLDIDALKEELEKLKFILFGPKENIISFMEGLVPTYTRDKNNIEKESEAINK